MLEIARRISFGMGVAARERVDHPVLERIREADFAPQRKLAKLAADQLGTVGSGNHYVNLMADEDDAVWVGVHFGRRGFGHRRRRASSRSRRACLRRRAKGGAMDSPPVLLRERHRARTLVRRGDGARRRVRLRRP